MPSPCMTETLYPLTNISPLPPPSQEGTLWVLCNYSLTCLTQVPSLEESLFTSSLVLFQELCAAQLTLQVSFQTVPLQCYEVGRACLFVCLFIFLILHKIMMFPIYSVPRLYLLLPSFSFLLPHINTCLSYIPFSLSLSSSRCQHKNG